MDNRINEFRRKISVLRAEMMDLEAAIRGQIRHGLGCAEFAQRLIAMRKELIVLVDEWKAAGGGDRLPDAEGRFRGHQGVPTNGAPRRGAARR